MARAPQAIPEGYHTLTPVLTFDDAAGAIDWYKKALNAEETFRAPGPDGKIMHAELRIGDSHIMLNDEVMGQRGPRTLNGSPVSLWLYVPDCDALFEQAVGAGGQIKYPMADQFWGDRTGSFADPHGYTWTIATHKEDLSPEEMRERQDEFMKKFAGSGM